MNKLKFGLLLVSLGLFMSGYSQLNDFDLSKYKLPDFERYFLETRLNLSGSNVYDKFQSRVDSSYASQGQNGFGGNLDLIYNHILNNSDSQRETNADLSFYSGSYNGKEMSEVKRENSQLALSLYFQRNNRKYLNERSFYESIFNVRYNIDNSRSSYYNDSGSEGWNKTISHNLLASLPLKVGRGRIEQVQDARQAIYIFEELSKNERVSSEISKEQITEFSKLISKLKNERFFDSRLKRIAELESIDSFLVANDFVSKHDTRYFTTLSDIWEYGNRPIRSSGTRYSLAIYPGFSYDYNDNSSEELSGNNYFSRSAILLDGGFEIKHEKPINLQWQNSVYLKCLAGIIEGKMVNKRISDEFKIRMPNVQLSFNQTLGYYPNTRTDVSFGYSLNYIQVFGNTDSENHIFEGEAKAIKAATELSVNYYISPKFRLNLSSRFYSVWQNSKDNLVLNLDNISVNNHVLNIIGSNSSISYREKLIRNFFNLDLIYSIF